LRKDASYGFQKRGWSDKPFDKSYTFYWGFAFIEVNNRAFDFRLERMCRFQNPSPLHKAQIIHEKLGGTGIIDDPVFKPKGMHWRTYSRRMERMREAESGSFPPWIATHVTHNPQLFLRL
jgi:hypothetical protein